MTIGKTDKHGSHIPGQCNCLLSKPRFVLTILALVLAVSLPNKWGKRNTEHSRRAVCRVLSNFVDLTDVNHTICAACLRSKHTRNTHTHRPCIQTVVSCVLTFRVQLATGEYNRITDPSTEQPGTHCGRINVNRKWIECEIGKFNWAERQMRTPRVCVRDSHRRIISSCVFVWFGGYISQ